MNRLRIKPITTTTTTTNIYKNDGSQLTGWTISGAVTISNTIGIPTPSISVPNSTNCYYNVTGITTFKNHTIQFDIYTGVGSLINFYFACNSSGSGQMFRLETRPNNYSGFINTASWTTWSAPASGKTLSPTTWYTIKITVSDLGVATYTYNGSAIGIGGSGTYTISDNGTYIGIIGDGITGGYVDNIIIT